MRYDEDTDEYYYREEQMPEEQYTYEDADGYFEGPDYEDDENEIQFSDSEGEQPTESLKDDPVDQEW